MLVRLWNKHLFLCK